MRMARADEVVALTTKHGPAYLDPLPIVVDRADGCWLTDMDGRRYLDLVSGFSALNHGHRHPRLLATLVEQAGKLSVASRTVFSRELATVARELCALTGLDRVVLMNSGSEAVETALKIVRRFGHERRQLAPGSAEIIVCNNNYHGRMFGALSASDAAHMRAGFAPLMSGFKHVPFGDSGALAAAITDNTVAFLLEPIQSEGGIIVPPSGYLKEVRALCDRAGIAMVADEIQVGLGRTGHLFACASEGVTPDLMLLGKSLGGGLLPVSAVVGKEALMRVLGKGTHGGTLAGNPLACAVAYEALRVTVEEELALNAHAQGARFAAGLARLSSPWIREVRGRGLLLGILLSDAAPSAREVCLLLLQQGIVCSEARHNVIRLLPPLTIQPGEVDWALQRLARVFGRDGAST
jgi:ornithine--oxo-acid transaminase